MEISFCDTHLGSIFNSFELLRKSYGPDIAHSIAIRMGVLRAAPVLSLVPKRPPVSFKPVRGGYVVSLANSHILKFRASGTLPRSAGLDQISAIEIIGIDG